MDLRRRRAGRRVRGERAVLSNEIARILIWSVGDSKTTIEELREHLPLLPEGSYWISNGASERFGLVCLGDLPEEAVLRVRELIGHDPEVGEEFDVEE